jgi:hypothetical protein
VADRRRRLVQAIRRRKEAAMKGQEKPKKVAKKPAQKTLKERRAAKRDASAKAPRLDV